MIVYLAGPITGLSYDEAMGWREVATTFLKDCDIVTVSPMRGKSFFQGDNAVNKSRVGQLLTTDKGIVARDRMDVMHADVLLVNMCDRNTVSIGTLVELGWADAWRIPIILITSNPFLSEHPFIREIASFIVATLEEALEIVVALRV